MAFTVTATPGGPSFQRGVDLKVTVLTNATENGGAKHETANPAGGTPGGSLTPNFSGSYVAFSVSADNLTTMAAAATSNTYDYSPGGHTDTWCARMGHYSGTITGGSALTYGASSGAGDDHFNACAYEVPASGGTITVDGSSPAGVFSDTGTSNTTASFNPPAGSILVAEVASGGSGAGAGQTCTMSDTSGLGIVWTKRAQSSTSDNFQVTFIFTATVPQPVQSGQETGDVWGARPWSPQLAKAFGPTEPFVPPGSGVYYPPPPPPPPGVPPPPPLPLPPAMGHAGLPGMPGGTAFGQYPVPATEVGNTDPPYIAGLAGTNYDQHFVDNLGNPVLLLSEQCWALPWNAGRWNGGNWQYDFAEYFSARQKQGYNAWFGVPFGTFHVDSTCLSGGRTWDGIYPLTVNGTPGAISSTGQTVGLNEPFWARFAAMVDTARIHGITCFANLSLSYNISDTGGIWSAAGNTQASAFGAALAARFPQSRYPNLFFFWGDDDDGPNDSFYSAMLSGMQGAGDTRALISTEQFTNTNCHVAFSSGGDYSGVFGANATYNFVYSYDATYFGVETSYTETTHPKIPPIYGDGVYYGDTGSGTIPDRVMRTFAWWSLSSGARGFTATSGPSDLGGGGIWTWQADATTRLRIDPNGDGSWCNVKAGAVRAFVAGLTDFQHLIPDTSNALITAGRGTRGTCDAPGGVFNFRNTSTYVSGSITPNGSLAIIYCKSAMSITIDESKMAAGYTATWVDPYSLATTPTTTGTTYSSSGLGNNAAGDPDWVLVLQGTPAPALSAGATVSETVAITATGVVGTSASATLSLTDTISDTASATGSASISETATITAAGGGTGSASISETVTITAAAAATGSASITETVTITAAGSAGATATITETVTITAAGSVSGSGVSATVSETVTLTADGVVATSTGATLASTDTITASGVVNVSGAASTVTETVAITAAGGVTSGVSSTLTATATITAGGAVATSSSAAVSIVATLLAAGVVGKTSGAALNLAFVATAAIHERIITLEVELYPARVTGRVADPRLSGELLPPRITGQMEE